jgi:hypothetical protein
LLFPSILAGTNCFHILSLLILGICPYHPISAIVYILQCLRLVIYPVSSYLFLFSNFLLLSWNRSFFLQCPSRILKEHVFLLRSLSGLLSPYLKTGHIKGLYIFFKISISVNILNFKGSLRAECAGFALTILELISTFYLLVPNA